MQGNANLSLDIFKFFIIRSNCTKIYNLVMSYLPDVKPQSAVIDNSNVSLPS